MLAGVIYCFGSFAGAKRRAIFPKYCRVSEICKRVAEGTREPIIHISPESASRKEHHSDAVQVESLERFMDAYPLAASKCHEIIFEIQLFCMLVVFYHLILWGILSSFELQISS